MVEVCLLPWTRPYCFKLFPVLMLRQWDDIEFYDLAHVWESVVFLRVVKQPHNIGNHCTHFVMYVINCSVTPGKFVDMSILK